MMNTTVDQYLHSLMSSEQRYLARVQEKQAIWTPQSEPQWSALLSRADELFYGGAAGGGKSDLVIGMAVECHKHSAIFRRVYPNLKEIIRRTRELLQDTDWNENKTERIWSSKEGRTIEFGAVQYEDDKTNWQGRPHDLKAFDELPEFTKSQYEFMIGWNRTTDKDQRVRVVATGNPPIGDAGSWIIDRWGAWLNPEHPNPASPGELRWYATVGANEQEFDNGDPVVIDGETIYPRSRTFIPARLDDNPYYSQDNRYRAVLQSLPEPLRSMMLYGDFQAAAVPDPFQVIPTEWVRLAQARWLEREKPDVPLSSVGIDPARGGRDNLTMCKRYDNYFDEIAAWPGAQAKDGPIAVELVRQALSSETPQLMNIDVIGVGSSVYDTAVPMYPAVQAVNVANGSSYRDRSGKLKMRNLRAEIYWRFREALDPVNGDDIALPPGNDILADLCAARYSVTSAGVQIENKDDIKARIGRSPDKGEAVLLAHYGSADWLIW